MTHAEKITALENALAFCVVELLYVQNGIKPLSGDLSRAIKSGQAILAVESNEAAV